MASKRKVIYRVKSLGIKPGDTAMVDADVAESLVTNRHAVYATDAPAEVKDAKSS